MIKIFFKQLFVYSLSTEKYFFTKFDSRINIVHGRNTSGKSTLIQSIIYSMGINDSKENLNDIFEYDIIFRLDCDLVEGESMKSVTFVRSDDTIVIRIDNDIVSRFDGISGNSSFEYNRYKKYFNSLIGFSLKLQKQTEHVLAPLEAALLPFYISQSVGWVYLRQSIGNYRFYKDFKFDFLDYYSGLSMNADRLKKYELEKQQKKIKYDVKQLSEYKHRNIPLRVAEALSQRFKDNALEYLERYNKLNNDLVLHENKHSKLCNEVTLLKMRQKVLSGVILNLKKQKPEIDKCPTCNQTLQGDLKEYYFYIQDVNDALKEKNNVAKIIKKKSADINSVEKKIKLFRSELRDEYTVLNEFKHSDVTFETWLDYHANLKLVKNIEAKLAICDEKITTLNKELEKLSPVSNIEEMRRKKNAEFLRLFQKNAHALNVKIPKSSVYRELYSISSFPLQGVELHKMIMAYHFAFNQFIANTQNIHRFPFLLDAVFKEDIDKKNREDILNFINSKVLRGDQVIFTVAEYKKDENDSQESALFNVNEINQEYFSNNAKLICIGNATTERAFLSSKNFHDLNYLNETLDLLDSY